MFSWGYKRIRQLAKPVSPENEKGPDQYPGLSIFCNPLFLGSCTGKLLYDYSLDILMIFVLRVI